MWAKGRLLFGCFAGVEAAAGTLVRHALDLFAGGDIGLRGRSRRIATCRMCLAVRPIRWRQTRRDAAQAPRAGKKNASDQYPDEASKRNISVLSNLLILVSDD